jgi:hypothetical protein
MDRRKLIALGKDICPRKVRIPGSVWLEWFRMMKPTAQGLMFKSSAKFSRSALR